LPCSRAAGFSSCRVCSHHALLSCLKHGCAPEQSPSENHGGDGHQECRLTGTPCVASHRRPEQRRICKALAAFSVLPVTKGFWLRFGFGFGFGFPPFYCLCTRKIFLITSFKRALFRKGSAAPPALRRGKASRRDEHPVCRTPEPHTQPLFGLAPPTGKTAHF